MTQLQFDVKYDGIMRDYDNKLSPLHTKLANNMSFRSDLVMQEESLKKERIAIIEHIRNLRQQRNEELYELRCKYLNEQSDGNSK